MPRPPKPALAALGLVLVVAVVVVVLVLDTTLGLIVGGIAAVVAFGTLIQVLQGVLGSDTPETGTPRGSGRTIAAFVAVAVVVVAVAGALEVINSSEADTANGDAGDAVDTARDFVTAAAVEQNGLVACGYLTGAQQRAVAAAQGTEDCREGVGAGASFVRGVPDTTDAVESLSERSREVGGRVTVELGAAGERITFVLRRADQSEEDASFAPSSDWRIERGAPEILQR